MDKASAELIPNWHFTIYNFNDLKLENQLLRNIYSYGLESPSHLQAKGIIAILKRRDVIAKSPPEKGKTICYCIALLQMKFIYPEVRKCQALIVSHKEDHVRYIHKILIDLGEKLKVDVRICMQVSDDVGKEAENVSEKFQIIVATPRAACDLVKKGYLKMKEVEIIVIDDVDKMIEQGALVNVTEILGSADRDVQKVMFSSMITPKIINLSERFLEDPAKIVDSGDEVTLEGVKQFYIELEKEEWKNETLQDLFDCLDVNHWIIYCNTVQRVIELEAWIKDKGMSVTCIHEEMERNQREQTQAQWRSGAFRILISTGFAPLKNQLTYVNLIILYDLPVTKERYLRLIGRKGRFEHIVAIILVTKDEIETLKETEKYFATDISELPLDAASIL